VTLSGSNLGSVTGVRFGGSSPVTSIIVTTGSVKAAVPPDAVTGPIAVVTPAGPFASAAAFKVLPKVTGFSPVDGPTGQVVTVTGSGLLGATAVRFGSVSAGLVGIGFVVDGPKQIRAWVPAGTTAGPVSVVTPAGTATSATAFGRTRITAFSPAEALTGATVTISGHGPRQRHRRPLQRRRIRHPGLRLGHGGQGRRPAQRDERPAGRRHAPRRRGRRRHDDELQGAAEDQRLHALERPHGCHGHDRRLGLRRRDHGQARDAGRRIHGRFADADHRDGSGRRHERPLQRHDAERYRHLGRDVHSHPLRASGR